MIKHVLMTVIAPPGAADGLAEAVVVGDVRLGRGASPGSPTQAARDPTFGTVAAEHHAPGDRAGHEDPTVGGRDAPEVSVGLEGGDEVVQAESDDTSADPWPASVFAGALPDQPGAADLAAGGADERSR